MSAASTPTPSEKSTPKPKSAGKAKAKPKIKITDLDENTYAAIMTQARALVKKEQQPVGGEPLQVLHEGQMLNCSHLICLLPPHVRFLVMEHHDIEDLDVEIPPDKPVKPSSNPALTRLFCGFSRDSTPNKLWKKGKGWKMVASMEVYLTIAMKTDTIQDWSLESPRTYKTFECTLNDSFGSRIAERHVLFNEGFSTLDNRKAVAGVLATQHRAWKIEAACRYKRLCEEWVQERWAWEIALVAEVWNHHRDSVDWPLDAMDQTTIDTIPQKSPYLDPDDCVTLVEHARIVQEGKAWTASSGLRDLLFDAGLIDPDPGVDSENEGDLEDPEDQMELGDDMDE
ncbi:hypothetical protein MMC18_009528 [Xylographa bjoerkii]|nr:hypothetical protein [Xylographa bjoerkii]